MAWRINIVAAAAGSAHHLAQSWRNINQHQSKYSAVMKLAGVMAMAWRNGGVRRRGGNGI